MRGSPRQKAFFIGCSYIVDEDSAVHRFSFVRFRGWQLQGQAKQMMAFPA